MTSVFISGFTTITTISLFDGVEDFGEIIDNIKSAGIWIRECLPENKFIRALIYGTGIAVAFRVTPILLRNTELFQYFERQLLYFHRTNGRDDVMVLKSELLADLSGEGLPRFRGDKLVILELNAGGGTNSSYYPDGCHVIATDDREQSRELLAHKFETNDVARVKFDRFVHTCPEELCSLPDNCVSAVVSFHSLCSARRIKRALDEIKRVLLPGGKIYFIEHVSDFRRFSWLWMKQLYFEPSLWLYSCCSRQTQVFLEEAGFSEVSYKEVYVDMSGIVGPLSSVSPHVYGYARK